MPALRLRVWGPPTRWGGRRRRPADSSAGTSREMSGPDPAFKIGDDVEGLRVLSELGTGAASSIYLVQDQKTKQVWSLKHVVRDDDSKDDRFLQQTICEYQ